ncbi:MAG: hypothetical protein RL571_2589 [Pseudomonadota bacterium]|jgi:small conductance mechanosensitive channel
MDATWTQKYQDFAVGYIVEFRVKIIATSTFWVLGRRLIGFAVRLVQSS